MVPEAWDLTTVAEDEVVFHLHSPDKLEFVGERGRWPGPGYEVITGLRPGTPVVRHGLETSDARPAARRAPLQIRNRERRSLR